MLELNDICLGCMGDRAGNLTCPHCGYTLGAPPLMPYYLKPGTVLAGKYLVGRGLGHGGFGVTYLALDTVLHIKLAIKEYLPQDCATRPAGQAEVIPFTAEEQKRQYYYGMDKFLEEARTLAQFDGHPNIVGVRDFFKENGTAYLVMNYLDGMTLKEYLLKRGAPMTYEQTLEVMLPVLDALHTVHTAGILHRDVSPDNIFLTRDGQVKVIDFGAARQPFNAQRSISVILKPGYAPEEQYRSHGRQGPWTDVYAAAATFYRMLTGKVPPESLDRLERDTLVPPSKLGVQIPTYAENVLLRAMAIRAIDRYASVDDFRSALLNPAPVEKPAAEPVPLKQESAEHTKTMGTSSGDDSVTRPAQPRPQRAVSSGSPAKSSAAAGQAHGVPQRQSPPRQEDPGTYPLKYTRSRKSKGKGFLVAVLVVLFVLLGVTAAMLIVNSLLNTVPSPGGTPVVTGGGSTATPEITPSSEESEDPESSQTPTPSPSPSVTPLPPELTSGTVASLSIPQYLPQAGQMYVYTIVENGESSSATILTGKTDAGKLAYVYYNESTQQADSSVYVYSTDTGNLTSKPFGGTTKTILPSLCAVGTSFTGDGGDCTIVAVDYDATILGNLVRNCIVVRCGEEYRFYAPGVGLHTIRSSLEEDVTPIFTLNQQKGTSVDINQFIIDDDMIPSYED